MKSALAIIPIVGSAIFIICAAASIFVDFIRLSRNGGNVDLIRYIPLATQDVKQPPYWIWVVGCTVFTPTVILTAMWQSRLAENMEKSQENLFTFGIVMGATSFLLAVVPTANAIGIGLHIFLATAFQTFGIVYGIQSLMLAHNAFRDNSLYLVRLVLLIGCGVAVAGTIITFPNHAGLMLNNRSDQEITSWRRWLGALVAFFQLLMGTCLGLIVASGAAETFKLDPTLKNYEIIGIIVAFVILTPAVAAILHKAVGQNSSDNVQGFMHVSLFHSNDEENDNRNIETKFIQ